ncbi:kinase-like domain-containing protein, partial [Tribonema minus]
VACLPLNTCVLLQFMARGSLCHIFNEPNIWQRVTPALRHQVLLDIAEGMHFLHSNNVYHRDLKSHNVLITDWGRAKLTDFGLSKTTSAVSSFTGRSTMGGGMVAYMAPEAFGNERCSASVSAKSDVYSYGIVTWEVLAGVCGRAGSTPWYGQSIVEVISAVTLRGETPPLPMECIVNKNVSHAEAHAGVMRRCWAASALSRPTFGELMPLISEASC